MCNHNYSQLVLFQEQPGRQHGKHAARHGTVFFEQYDQL